MKDHNLSKMVGTQLHLAADGWFTHKLLTTKMGLMIVGGLLAIGMALGFTARDILNPPNQAVIQSPENLWNWGIYYTTFTILVVAAVWTRQEMGYKLAKAIVLMAVGVFLFHFYLNGMRMALDVPIGSGSLKKMLIFSVPIIAYFAALELWPMPTVYATGRQVQHRPSQPIIPHQAAPFVLRGDGVVKGRKVDLSRIRYFNPGRDN